MIHKITTSFSSLAKSSKFKLKRTRAENRGLAFFGLGRKSAIRETETIIARLRRLRSQSSRPRSKRLFSRSRWCRDKTVWRGIKFS